MLFNFQRVVDELPEEKQDGATGQERRAQEREETREGAAVKCSCMDHVQNVQAEDLWKGHLCTVEMRRVKSPLLRAAMRKGHKWIRGWNCCDGK